MSTDIDYEQPTIQDEAERLVSYWEQHGNDPEVVARWAVEDLLIFARRIAEGDES